MECLGNGRGRERADRFRRCETISLVSLSLARLQHQTISHTKAFLDCGCGDQRIETLRRYLPEFLDSVAMLISDTALEDSGPDVATILPRMEHALRIALDEMGQLGIPDTINNNDMSSRTSSSTEDDAPSLIGVTLTGGIHFSPSSMCISICHAVLPALARPFQEAYAKAWAARLSESQVEGALALAPIVAPYAYLCAWGPASLVSCASDPSARKVLLNIVRRILAAGRHLNGKERQVYV